MTAQKTEFRHEFRDRGRLPSPHPRARARCSSAPARCCRAASRTMRAISTPIRSTSPRAKGPRKWDVDGNEYVDYFGGHGAMLLGHSHPAVIEAVKRQMDLGTHYGSSHELEVRWAELVCELIPSAEKVRFTASGTEASHMAIRLARAFTGKDKIVRFVGHFHGWHDSVAAGATSNYDGSVAAGLSAERHRSLHPDAGRRCRPVVKLLEGRDDIAAVMFEPSGASWGQVPLPPGFVQAIRDVTAQARRRDADLTKSSPAFAGRRAARRRRWASRPTSASWPRSSPAACRAAPSPASARSSTRSITRRRRRRSATRSPIPAPTTPIRCRPRRP